MTPQFLHLAAQREPGLFGRRFGLRIAGLRLLVQCPPQLAARCARVLEHYFPGTLSDPPAAPDRTIQIGTHPRAALQRVRDSLLAQGVATPVEVYKSETLLAVGAAPLQVFASPAAAPPRLYWRQGAVIAIAVEDAAHAEREVLRIARELATRVHESRGGVALHAAAAGLGGQGVVLLGRSGAGKTTLLLQLLKHARDAGFICNDRALCRVHDGVMTVFGSPLPVRFSAGTVNAEPTLCDYLRGTTERPQPASLALLQGRQVATGSDGIELKAELSPLELCGLYGARAVEGAPLALLVAPRFDAGATHAAARTLAPDALRDLLHQERRTPVDTMWPTPWIEPRDASLSAQWDGEALAALPAFELRFGPCSGADAVALLVSRLALPGLARPGAECPGERTKSVRAG